MHGVQLCPKKFTIHCICIISYKLVVHQAQVPVREAKQLGCPKCINAHPRNETEATEPELPITRSIETRIDPSLYIRHYSLSSSQNHCYWLPREACNRRSDLGGAHAGNPSLCWLIAHRHRERLAQPHRSLCTPVSRQQDEHIITGKTLPIAINHFSSSFVNFE